MLFSAHPNIHYRTFFHFIRKIPLPRCEISHRQRDPAQLYPAYGIFSVENSENIRFYTVSSACG